MDFTIPEPLKAEHTELHAELADAMRAGGRTGEAAEKVAKLLHPHFVREEEIALPPLCLLAPLATGTVLQGMTDVLALTDRLEAELQGMPAEHGQIVAALGDLMVQRRRSLPSGHTPRLPVFETPTGKVCVPAALYPH